MIFRRLQICLSALLAFISACLAEGAEPAWRGDVWRVDEGLPNNTVNAIAQSPEGYLWLGTQSGLVRFDGDRFVPSVDHRLRAAPIRNLYLDRSGRLWVLAEKGGVAFIQKGRTKWLGDDKAIPADGFQAVAEDRAGQVWFGDQASAACFRFSGEGFVKVSASPESDYPGFTSMAFDEDGTLYGVANDVLWKIFPGEPKLVSSVEGEEEQAVTVVCPSRAGGFWALTPKECFHVKNGTWKGIAKLDQAPPNAGTITAAYEDRLGRLWWASWAQRAPVSISPDGVVEEENFNTLPRMLCRTLFEDREGNRWWSTAEDGIRRFRPADLRLMSERPKALAVSADGGDGVWMVSVAGLFHLKGDESAQIVGPDSRVARVSTLFVDGDETKWVGESRGGLLRVSDDQVARFTLTGSRNGGAPILTALFRDGDGNLLAGSARGIFRLTGSGLDPMRRKDATRAGEVYCFARAGDGRVLAGMDDGLWFGDNKQWSRASTNVNGAVAAIWCDADNAQWLAIAGQGLWRKRGEDLFAFRTTRLALPANIFGIIEDKLNHLWLTSAEGIFRVARADLNGVAEGRVGDAFVRRFDREDGMISSQCASGAQVATRTRDGRLWFATNRGVYAVDPATLSQNTHPPTVVVEEALVDDKRAWSYFAEESAERPREMQVSHDHGRIEFRFTALSLRSASRNRFRFKLENFDREWEEAAGRRVAYYKRVPPGNYKFKVMASNNDGVWSEEGATLAMTVLTPWWQTAWFRIMAVTSTVLALFAGYRYSLWRQNEIARLRLRIASDLHDEVGSNLGSIALKAEMLQNNGVNRADLADINLVALRTANDVRDVAWFINPDFDTLSEMGMRMREVAARMLTGLDWKFEFADGADRKLTLEFRRNVFFIFKEMLHNVIKHANARTVTISARDDGRAFSLEVRDDGVGFTNVKSGGQGRRNMDRRAREIGGSLFIESAPGRGTVVRLETPFRASWFSTHDK